MDHVPPQHQHDAGGADRHGVLTTTRRYWLAGLALLALCGFVALGAWQWERRAWKLDLIARVEARVHAAPVPLPSSSDWRNLTPDAFEYRRVRMAGSYLRDRETLVQAVTERGPGFWVLTPLRTTAGTILVNRGFVPSGLRGSPATRAPEGPVSVTGLMRVSEPGGGFLRANDPGANRWYSRDVAAIARARRLTDVAPFFVDAEASADPRALPVGGLTVIRFSNNHLVYALTWFGLAGLCGFAAVRVWRERGVR